MMFVRILALASPFLLFAFSVTAKLGDPPPSQDRQVLPLVNVAELVLPATDVRKELAVDIKAKVNTPLRYAVVQKVAVTPDNYGTWEQQPDGRLWRLRVSSKGATDLNLGFTTFWLPDGATLHIVSGAEKYYQGPYTYDDNTTQNELWTPVVPGDNAIVELFVPSSATQQPKLVLTQIGAGYRDLFRRRKDLNSLKLEGCEIDVACAIAQPWANEVRSVARYSVSGSVLCTGTLIADAAHDFRNYFLTANHCEVTAGSAASVVVYWNFQSPACGQHGGGSLSHNQSGTTFRAAKYDVDFCLLQLNTVPDPSFNVYYAGWDRTGVAPSGGVGIHHPNADEKSISFSSNSLATINSCVGTGGVNTHWNVVWTLGVTEPGSSGSGIWNISNHRLIGTLSGGTSDCSNRSGPDCYGKFSVAWASGGAATNRLRDWLDPLNTGVAGVDGVDPPGTPIIVADGFTVLSESCDPGNNAIDPGEIVTVNFNLLNTGRADTTNLIATLLPGGGVTQPSGPQTYGVLTSGGPDVSRPFSFAANGQCGGKITASLRTQDGSKIRTNKFVITLGVAHTSVIFSQNFDGVAQPKLPSGWSSSFSGSTSGWATSTARSDTAPNSVYASDPGGVSDNVLLSPYIYIASANSQLTFHHSYDFESGYDGGVLEISISGGAFTDILSAGGSFVANGYNATIPPLYSNPLGGRSAWSGNSGGFTTTTVKLPAAAAGKTIQLRWHCGSDESVAGTGWYVDSVSISQTGYQCCNVSKARPTVSIVFPTAGQRVTNNFAPLVVRGRASDNVQVTNVQLSLNSGPWTDVTTTNGWTNWTASIEPLPRTNALKAYSMDEVGHKSLTNAVSFIYVVTSPLTLITNGLGTITRTFSGNILEIGRTYIVTAVPGAGQVFSNWVGSITSTNAALTFVMQSNMVLQANFIPNPFLPAKGTYYGLFAEPDRAQNHSGFFTLSLGSSGAFSASLVRGTNTFPFSGGFGISGTATATAVSAGTNSWVVNMALDLGSGEDLSGTIGNSQWLATLVAHRAVFNAATNPASLFAGKYTLIIPGSGTPNGAVPDGDSYATVNVGPGGNITMSGSLSDGNTLNQVVPIAHNGDWPLYQSRYAGKGSVWGWLLFQTNNPAADITGDVSWVKQAVPGAVYYPHGFTNLTPAQGSRYAPPSPNTSQVIALTNGIEVFEGGNLSESFTNEVTLTETNRVINDSPNALSFTITITNGTFSGKIQVPGTLKTNTFKGALLQDQAAGSGFFLGTNQSGRVSLEPAP